MANFITLVARPEDVPLTPVHLELVQNLLRREGATGLRPKWLEARKAAQIRFSGMEGDRGLELANEALTGAPLDIGIQSEGDQKKS